MKVQLVLLVLVSALERAFAQDGLLISDPPSSMPSDFPSVAPSDAPSFVPSSSPSTLPSDYPSNVPVSWNDAEIREEAKSPTSEEDEMAARQRLEGFEICGFSDYTYSEMDDLRSVRIFYLYKLGLESSVELEEVSSSVESIIREAVLDATCMAPEVSLEEEPGRAVAVSSGDPDTTTGSCGQDCYVLLGSVSILVDNNDLAAYRALYCKTMHTIKHLITEGTLTLARGVSSTGMFNDSPGVSSVECPEVDPSPVTTHDVILRPSTDASDGASNGIIYGAAACGFLVMGVVLWQRRHRSQRQEIDGLWQHTTSDGSQDYGYSQSESNETGSSPWLRPGSMEAA